MLQMTNKSHVLYNPGVISWRSNYIPTVHRERLQLTDYMWAAYICNAHMTYLRQIGATVIQSTLRKQKTNYNPHPVSPCVVKVWEWLLPGMSTRGKNKLNPNGHSAGINVTCSYRAFKTKIYVLKLKDKSQSILILTTHSNIVLIIRYLWQLAFFPTELEILEWLQLLQNKVKQRSYTDILAYLIILDQDDPKKNFHQVLR